MNHSEEISHILSQVATFDAELREINKKRAALLQRLNSIRSHIVSRLPPEILSRILWYASGAHSLVDDPDKPPPSDTEVLIKLTAVCSHFRQIVQSSPELSSSLSVTGERGLPSPLSWDKCTELQLRDTSPEYALRLLSLCPNLIEFDFGYDVGDWGPLVPPSCEVVSMQYLQRLIWIAWGRDGPRPQKPKPVDVNFFTHCRFPAIRELMWDVPLPSDAPSIRDFFAAMQHLEELDFSPSKAKHCIDQHLDLFGNLTKLEVELVDNYRVMQEWLHRLTIKPGAENLFPRLRELHLTVGDVAPHGLIVLLYSRRNGPVDWSSPRDDPARLTLPPYDPTSTHWLHHARLMEFSTQPFDNGIAIDFTWSPHYQALRTMIAEAKEVEDFEVTSWRSRILF